MGAIERKLSLGITTGRTVIEEMERKEAAAFVTPHAMMAIAHRHLRTKFAILIALGADPIGAEIGIRSGIAF
jgi:hypothetical protein